MHHRTKHALWALIVGLAAGIAVAALFSVGIGDQLELKSYDWRMALTRHAAKGSGQNVALLYVDEPSLDTMKGMGITWPWPRELYAGALAFAKRGGAKAVLFDLFFSEDSSYGVADDEGFGRGIADGPPSYFVFFASKNEGEAPSVDSEVLARSRVPFGGTPPAFLPEARSLASLPIPAIARNAAGFGNAQTAPDADGIFRRLPPALRMGDLVLPQIALEVAAAAGDFGVIDWTSRTDLRIDGQRIPLDSDGNLLINYIGGVDSYPVYPLAQVLVANQQLAEGKTPDLDPAVLRDRVVIVGVAAPGLYDLKPSPLARVYPGPEVHATVIDSLLQRSFITPLGTPAQALIVLLLAILAAVGISQLERLTHLVPWIAGIAAAYVIVSVLLFGRNLWIPLAAPIIAMALASFSMMLYRYLTEGRRRRAIKRAFGQYLSPAVVGEIAADPDNVRMGGEEREVSVFFSDIADFTSISERMAPPELVERLCRYLTEVTGIITGREGTLDKYIGDAVMAFWGAPLAMPDHAAAGVLAALEIQQALAVIPEFVTRIGIHTGRAVVGNIGSDLRFNYTVIGDTVNLASRLEGLNKQFGTRILVSEATWLMAREAVEGRMIGRVRVKGREEPLAIYEPLAPRGKLPADEALRISRFQEALDRFLAGDLAAARTAFSRLTDTGDATVASYVALCDKVAASTSDRPFDGVITFHEK